MSRSTSLTQRVNSFLGQHPHKIIFVLIGVLLLYLHLFIFRDVLFSIASLWQGESVIVRDELVPFFNFDSQFFSQIVNDETPITLTEEVRLAYSFWFAWVRYYKFLPIALILVNTLSAYILFYATYYLLNNFYQKKTNLLVYISLISSLLIHLILLYSKLTHFYVMIIGFSLFALSNSYALVQIFFRDKISIKNILLVSIVTLINPSIHFHILFYLILALALVSHLTFSFFTRPKEVLGILQRNLIYFFAVIIISLIPYGLYIWFILTFLSSSVSDSIPVNYWMIYYASSNLLTLFSLDTTAQIDMYQYGNYLPNQPRSIKVIVVVISILSIYLSSKSKKSFIQLSFLIISLAILVFSVWASMGFFYSFSYHALLQYMSTLISNQDNLFTNFIGKAMSAFIQILRYPHRFNLIQYYFIIILFSIGLLELKNIFPKNSRSLVLIAASSTVLLISIVSINADYRKALFSGDFNSFLKPYPIPQDLTAIKKYLQTKQNNRIFILPTLESGREIMTKNNRYSFIDKFLIYYLDQPTFYYGTGANARNKITAFPVYQSILDNSPWWEDIMRQNLKITHILYPKHIIPRPNGLVYLPEIDQYIPTALDTSTQYKKVYSGLDYELYEVNNTPIDGHIMINYSWTKLQNILNNRGYNLYQNKNIYFPIQHEEFMNTKGEKLLITDNLERSYYDLYLSDKSANIIFDTSQIPFTSSFTHSSFYTSSPLSMNTLSNADTSYNYFNAKIPNLINLHRTSFIGVKENNLSFKIDVTENNTYRIIARGASLKSTITVSINGILMQLQSIEQELPPDNIEFSYYYADIPLSAGTYDVKVLNPTQEPILIEFLYLLKPTQLPQIIENQSVESKELIIRKSENPGIYTVIPIK